MLDITGQRFGKLVAVSPASKRYAGGVVWVCRCDCGAETEVTSNRLRTGNSKSCGCGKSEATTKRNKASAKHNQAHTFNATPTYRSWAAMKRRCLVPHTHNYAEYGGRGIKIHGPWLDFVKFYEDMGDRPEGTTLDRIDSNGNYEPGNVRWATTLVQQNNRRDCVLLDYEGKTMSVSDWARHLGVKVSALRMRLNKGWSVEKTLSTSVEYRKPRE